MLAHWAESSDPTGKKLETLELTLKTAYIALVALLWAVILKGIFHPQLLFSPFFFTSTVQLEVLKSLKHNCVEFLLSVKLQNGCVDEKAPIQSVSLSWVNCPFSASANDIKTVSSAVGTPSSCMSLHGSLKNSANDIITSLWNQPLDFQRRACREQSPTLTFSLPSHWRGAANGSE